MKSEKCLSIKMEDENLFVGGGGGWYSRRVVGNIVVGLKTSHIILT